MVYCVYMVSAVALLLAYQGLIHYTKETDSVSDTKNRIAVCLNEIVLSFMMLSYVCIAFQKL